MHFGSDNWAGATPEVMDALARHNQGATPAYGADPLTGKLRGMFSQLFEREVEMWFVGTGTAANTLGLSGLSRPGGMVLCSEDAHVDQDEWGGFEFQTGGMKLIATESVDGKIAPEALAAKLARYPAGNRFGQLVGLSLTNATEVGTVYRPEEVAALAAPAKASGLAVHMDGARFGNAVAATGASPAELTWKSGIDFMSFGGTKNGCWAAEAIVVFTPGRLADIMARRQRAGHTFSKARFMAAQFEGYLSAGKWLERAGHANRMAETLRAGFRASNSARLGWESQTNEVFAVIPEARLAALRAAGGSAYEWDAPQVAVGPDEVLVRMVTSWATTEDEVSRFLALG